MGLFDKFLSNDNNQGKEEAPKPLAEKRRNSSVCPSCGAVFADVPKRKSTCPECKTTCYVRTKQTIFNSDLLSEEQMLAADFFAELMEYGASVADYIKKERLLTQKWGFKPNPYDVVWSVSMTCIDKYALNLNSKHGAADFLHKAKMLAFSQAKYQARRGKKPTEFLAPISKYDADIQKLQWEAVGVNIEEYAIETYNCCSECNKYQGKTFTYAEIEKNNALPVKACTYKFDKKLKPGWCTCSYQAIAP